MFENQISALKSFDIHSEYRQAIREVSSKITELNKKQLKSGILGDGSKLSPYTVAYAKKKNKPRTPKTLYDKGDFYNGFYANPMVNYLEIGSHDKKEGILENNWGDVHGLTENNEGIVEELILERLNKKINELF